MGGTQVQINPNAPAVARREIKIKARPEEVWAIHTDIDGWWKWNADINESKLHGQLTEGATFIDVFRELRTTYGFSAAGSYSITTRVYRAGGLTKDAVYLRGLVGLLEYLAAGGELEPLFVGKVAIGHIPVIRELRLRGVLRDPPLRPRYLDLPEARNRLRLLRQGATVYDLMEEGTGRGSGAP